jgi:hypothetical protein
MLMRRRPLSLILIGISSAFIACSNPDGPNASGGFAQKYHLRSVDGVHLPIVDTGGEILDSGHVIRLGGDTVRVDDYSHLPGLGGMPGIGTIRLGTWLASQSGNVVALFPLIATSIDTAFLSGDTLTLHTHSSHVLQVRIFVAP